MIEYALLAAFVSLAVYVAIGLLGGSLNNWYDAVAGNVSEKAKKSNCSPTGIAHSQGKCL